MGRTAQIVKWLSLGGILAGCAAGTYVWAPGLYTRWMGRNPAADARQDLVRFATARRGDLKIVITEDGKLRAIKSHAVYSQLRGQARISWLITEGTAVKKGDKLIEFDKKPSEDALQSQTAELEAAKRQLVVAEEALTIQRSTSMVAMKMAATKLDDAKVALSVYENLEGPKRINELETAINDARAKYNTAQKTLTDAQKRMEDQLSQEEDQKKGLEKEIAVAKESAESIRKAVDTCILQQKIFRRYDYPQNHKARGQAVENAQLDLEKAKISASSEVNQKAQELAKVKDTITRLTRQTDQLKEDISRCTLTAPADGMVLFGDPNNPYRSYGGEQGLRVGMDWYGSNMLMTIPDTTEFEVVVSIGEEYRGRLQPGCAATLTVQAIPGLIIQATLKKIENLARGRISWDPSSPKVFDGVLTPLSNDQRMLSGMTTRVEIVAEVLKDVVTVPVEAVFNDDGTPVCYVRDVRGSQRRAVQVGKGNDHVVEIVSGLAEGEQLDLSPPRGGAGGAGGAGPTSKPSH